MVRQYRHPVGEVIIELPGGCVDDTDKDYSSGDRKRIDWRKRVIAFTSYESLGKNFT
jgi:hypothetical protein